MAATLPPEQHASYGAIIDGILANADLNTISAKAIRKDLQAKVEYDLTPQKAAITALIMERFDKVHQQQNGTAVAEPAPTANGHDHDMKDASQVSPPASTTKRKTRDSDTEQDESSSLEDSSPAPKKVKKSKGPRPREVETDAQLAARLQRELNAVMARSTRGGGAKRKSTTTKKTKKKSSAKVNADDDSDLETSGVDKPERPKTGGFHKPMTLSAPLSAMLGETTLSRPQTVKKIWEYVKARDMQDPNDKRQIICDDAMRAVFKGDKVHMFTMNKLLANHLYPADEAAA